MGIPSYFKHIITSYRNIIKEYSVSLNINNLYLDSNSIIYDVILQLEDKGTNNIKNIENLIFKNTCHKIVEYISVIKPSDCVFIAFDGVAPVAKLHQQKTRRYKGEIEKDIFSRLGHENSSIFNRALITPGTSFMNKLEKYVEKFFSNDEKFGVKKIIVNGPNKSGEGEHKIYEYIRTNIDFHKDRKTVIYGLDADLLMLTLNHLEYTENLYLFRETPHFIQSLDKSLEPNKSYLIDMPKMADKIVSDLDIETANVSEKINLLRDYIFIFFFLGNDFLPHFPALNIRTDGINRITAAYQMTLKKVGNLTNNNNINWKNLQVFIEILSKQEEQFIIEENYVRDKQSNKIKKFIKDDKDYYLNLPILDRVKEEYINVGEDGWEERYYNILLNVERSEQNVKNIVINYFEGLEWTLKYYTTGCVDWAWYYKHNYPPLLIDINYHVPHFNISFIDVDNNNQPVDPQVQLAYVLPKSCLHYMNKKLYNNLIKKGIKLGCDNSEIEYAYCRYIWEGHINGECIELEKLKKIIEYNK